MQPTHRSKAGDVLPLLHVSTRAKGQVQVGNGVVLVHRDRWERPRLHLFLLLRLQA